MLIVGADASQVNAEELSLFSAYLKNFKKFDFQSHLHMLLKHDFDVDLLNELELQFTSYRYLRNHIAHKNILRFNAYAKMYNKWNEKHPVKVKCAQSMIQVMYKDVIAYLPSVIIDE
jgi:hypothetical protein